MEKRILVIGHSHVAALQKAGSGDPSFEFRSLMKADGLPSFLEEPLDESKYAVIFGSIRGNKYNTFGLVNNPKPFDFVLPTNPDLPMIIGAKEVAFAEMDALYTKECAGNLSILKKLRQKISGPFVVTDPPPPIPDASHIEQYPNTFDEKIKELGVAPAAFRYKLWKLQSIILQRFCKDLGIGYIPVPTEALDEAGFLAKEFWNLDPTHGNQAYGALVLKQLRMNFLDKKVEDSARSTVTAHQVSHSGLDRSLSRTRRPEERGASAPQQLAKQPHPYRDLPDHCFWRRTLPADGQGFDVPFKSKFRIHPSEPVATAGSCFAQHILRHLNLYGFSGLITEAGDPSLSQEESRIQNYGIFTARYGNLYTPRQLVQLFERVYGNFIPIEDVWLDRDGRAIDPYRPQIQPNGFASIEALAHDRQAHFAATRKAFEQASVFVFTLGLTESWCSRADGAVFPLAPGVSGGAYDAKKHVFQNFGVDEIVADLERFLQQLASVNRAARVVLTVSPVPLMASAVADQHVLLSTTYSKSVLRVACELISSRHPQVAYFPSYEIIAGGFARGRYFASDLRGVTESGVQHVMQVFFRHFSGVDIDPPERTFGTLSDPDMARHLREMEEAARVNCEEEALGSDDGIDKADRVNTRATQDPNRGHATDSPSRPDELEIDKSQNASPSKSWLRPWRR